MPSSDHTHDRDLLLDLPVPFVRDGDRLLVEAQAFNGLMQWQKHFARMTVTAPVVSTPAQAAGQQVLKDPAEWLAATGTVLMALPCAWAVTAHLRHQRDVRRQFMDLIPRHRYLCFSNLGGFGAWGSQGASAARAQGRPYAVWLDIVNELNGQWLSRSPRAIARRLYSAYNVAQTERAIGGARLGLFHGKSVYDAYQHLPSQPEVVHNIHLKAADAISTAALHVKLNRPLGERPFKIGYAGRAHPDKGPMQWLQAAARLIERLPKGRVTFCWLGDGPALPDMVQFVRERGLGDVIELRGFVSDRQALLAWMQDLDVFMFCHLTRESPRNLIESLLSGTPIVGYASSYAEDLLDGVPAGRLTPTGDPESLSDALMTLISEPERHLQPLTAQTGQAANIFSDDKVFAHRSELIKQYL